MYYVSSTKYKTNITWRETKENPEEYIREEKEEKNIKNKNIKNLQMFTS